MWYHQVIGGGRCPIVDTWWQTETGAIMISPLPGAIADQARQRDAAAARHRRRGRGQGRATRCRPNQGGFLVIKRPWPCMLRTIYGDDERYKAAVLEPGARTCYFTADGARRDEDGYFWIMGRVDDVLNVARPPAEHDGGRERPGASPEGRRGRGGRPAGRPQGRGRSAASSRSSRATPPTDELKKELKAHVVKEIGALARPDDIRFTDALPKTRSGQDHAAAAARHRRRPASRPATRRRWRTSACWPSCARKRSETERSCESSACPEWRPGEAALEAGACCPVRERSRSACVAP